MLLLQIVSFLLDVVGGLLTGACLLRLYMQWQRVPFGNPVGWLVFALSNWLVLPLRKLLRTVGRWDLACLTGALLVQLVVQAAKYLLRWQLLGSFPHWAWLPGATLLGTALVTVSGLMGLLIVYVVLSWVQQNSPISDVLARLCNPVLRPVRRVLPLLGGWLDLSALVVLVLLQVVMMVLGYLKPQMMMY